VTEVSFHDAKQCLGLADPQQQACRAVARTAPLAGLVYAPVLLWSAGQVERGRATGGLVRPWYRTKTAPSFLDLLTALRQDSHPLGSSAPPCPPRRLKKPVHQTADPLAAAA
jgi:hypothetical protein